MDLAQKRHCGIKTWNKNCDLHTKLSHRLLGKAKVMWFLKEVSPKLCVPAQCFVNPVLALGLQVHHFFTVYGASQRGHWLYLSYYVLAGP